MSLYGTRSRNKMYTVGPMMTQCLHSFVVSLRYCVLAWGKVMCFNLSLVILYIHQSMFWRTAVLFERLVGIQGYSAHAHIL